jgi:hypothetical protein
LEWLRADLVARPDARIVDRIEAWVQAGGRRVGHTAMWLAIRACGWTHKKRRWSLGREIGRTSKRSDGSSPPSSQR